MKRMCNVFAKGLFGAKYERIKKILGICVMLFIGLNTAEFRIEIAPSILYLMSVTLTAGVMWKAISSEKNIASMQNILMLPFDGRKLTIAYISMLGAYAILTNTGVIWAIAFAVSTPSIAEVIVCVLWAFIAVIATSFVYYLRRATILGASWCGFSNPYIFYVKATKKRQGKLGRRYSVWRYLFRYMLSHRNYLVNTIIMWGGACVLPMLFGEMDPTLILPMGFAILSMNTPICILISCDLSLEQAIRFLPDQKCKFIVPYGLFIFFSNLIVDLIFLVSWDIRLGGITLIIMGIAVLFASLGALGSVLLEWFWPLKNWKIESDLWHHPRKYVVPGMLVLLAGIIGMC